MTAQYRSHDPIIAIMSRDLRDILHFYAWESWYHLLPGSVMKSWTGAWVEVTDAE